MSSSPTPSPASSPAVRRRRRALALVIAVGTAVGLALLVAPSPAEAAAPSNDLFADAQVLTGPNPTARGTNYQADRETGEPAHAFYAVGQSVWYAWTAPAAPGAYTKAQVSLLGSDFDTTLTVYDGSAPPFSNLHLVTFADDFQGYLQSVVSFVPTPGTTYYIAVDGVYDGVHVATGKIKLAITDLGSTGSISGTVTGPGATPVADVCAWVVDGTGADVRGPARTSASGEYVLANAPVGTDHIVFRNCGAANVAGEFYNDAQTIAGAANVVVTAGVDTPNVNAQLATGSTITGHVTNGANASPDVCVVATKTSGGDLGAVRSAITDESGDYTITGLDGGTYQVEFGGVDPTYCAGASGFYLRQFYDDPLVAGPNNPVLATEGATTSGIDADIGIAGSITGTVTTLDGGDPVNDICVRASGASYTSPLFDTDPSGHYTITNLPAAADYVVRFTDCHATSNPYLTLYWNNTPALVAASPVTVIPGTATTNINAQMYHAGSIAGTVTDANGNPRGNACASLYNLTGGNIDDTHVDDAGHWEFDALPPAGYKIEISQCAGGGFPFNTVWWNNQPDFTSATVINVADGQSVTGIDLSTAGTGDGMITGHVTDEQGDPLPGVCIQVGGQSVFQAVDNNGNYSVSLPAGSYTVGFTECTPGELNVLPQAYDNTDWDHADPVVVLAGSLTANIDATMHPGGQILGRLVDAEGHGVRGMCADLFDLSGQWLTEVISDTNGYYSINSLYSGTYNITYEDCANAYQTKWYHDAPDQAHADPVVVVTGAPTLVSDVELERNGFVSGFITDEAGHGIANACAYLYQLDGTQVGVSDLSAGDGYYRIGTLTTGDYLVSFLDCNGPHGAEYYDNQLTSATATHVHVVFGQETPGINAVLQSVKPANSVLPTIVGNPYAGSTLGATQGTWLHEPSVFAYQWNRCDSGGGSCVPIGGATHATYLLTQADVGHRLNATVTATNSIGDTPATTANTAVIDTPPAPVTSPTIAGQPGIGVTFTSTDGTWSGSPTSFTREWLRCDAGGGSCTSIPGATGTSYQTTSADGGFKLQLRVTASNPGGSATNQSTASAVIGLPKMLTGPTVAGLPGIGSTLTGTDGTWVGPPTSYTYQWRRCDTSGASCSDIASATASSYQTTGADAGSKLRLRVTASNTVGSTAADTGLTGVIGFPLLLTAPTAAGDSVVGATLTSTDGTWSGPVTGYAYQWRRCDANGASCSDISSATSSTYQTVGADAGNRLRLRVTATTSGVGSATADTGPTAVIGLPRVLTGPVVTGQPSIGATLSTTDGTWSGPPTSWTYQWRRCDSTGAACTDIPGATNATYDTTSADGGHKLRARVTASNTVGSTATDSAATPVIGLPTLLTTPQMSGQAQVGATLSTTDGTWTGPPTSITYQWLRCDSAGNNCASIPGATAASYQLVVADAGSRVRARVTATNTVGSGVRDTSATSVVTLLQNTVSPVITGSTAVGGTLTASQGSWTATPTDHLYAWFRCDSTGLGCTAIPGATSSTYDTVVADSGHRLRVRVTAVHPTGNATATSGATQVIGLPYLLVAPKVTGLAGIGSTLTTTDGSWTGSPSSFAYAWVRCDSTGAGCSAIPGATGSTYDTTSDDGGHRIRVQVTATTSGGTGVGESSATAIIGLPTLLVSPTIGGSTASGGTLTVTTGTWVGPPTSFDYLWMRCDGAGNNCTVIPGATGTSYATTLADRGHRIRVRVTATNDVGSGVRDTNATNAIG